MLNYRRQIVNKNILQYIFILIGLACIVFTAFGISEHGYNLTGRDSPLQIEGGLVLFFIISGVAFVLYGAINIWFRK